VSPALSRKPHSVRCKSFQTLKKTRKTAAIKDYLHLSVENCDLKKANNLINVIV